MPAPKKNNKKAQQRYIRKSKAPPTNVWGAPKKKRTPQILSDPSVLDYPVRLNRYIARAGVCSRREADDLISRGRVAVDGETVSELGSKIDEEQIVTVRGKRIRPAAHIYLILNKPPDTITTASDEKGRTTVLDLIAQDRFTDKGLFPVGRLDRHTRGVLLITNDGKLAHRLMHPSFEIEKVYRVQTETLVTDEDLELLRTGIELEDGPAKADSIDRVEDGRGFEVGISIHEGRNRQIRRMFEKLGHVVKRLERVRYAGLTSTGVRPGKWRLLKEKEILKIYKTVDL